MCDIILDGVLNHIGKGTRKFIASDEDILKRLSTFPLVRT